MAQHSKNSQLVAGFKKCRPLVGPWIGAIYRFTELQYANRGDLLSGAGCRQHGGRWNPPQFNTIYGSLEAATAQEESFATYDKYGIPRSKVTPHVRVAINLKLQHVLDITQATVLKILGLTRKDIAAVDWEAEQIAGNEALTQAIGRIAWEERLEAIIVPSSRDVGGKNLVLFPGRRRTGSSWKISGAKDLPRKR